MSIDVTSRTHAEALDAKDPLAAFRNEFVIEDQTLSYFDDNHLNEAGSLRLKDEVIKTLLG